MKQEQKNKTIVYNYIYVINKDEEQYKKIQSLIKSNTLFKPINYSLSKTSTSLEIIQKKELPESKLIINNDTILNDINFDVNKENKLENNNTSSSLNNTKELTIEIVENKENKKFLSKKRVFSTNSEKRIGRLPKASLCKGYHTKFSHDNILRKIKVKFFHKIINFINSIILSKYRIINTLLPLKGKISQDNTINFNKELLYTKLKDIFLNYEINGKFKLYDIFYNKKIIEKIYEENIQELIDILEMTFLEAFNTFRNKNEDKKLNGLEKLDTVIEDIKLKENNEEYINKFRETVMNFEKYYLYRDPKK